jgi:hypothetical protein
VASSSSPDRKWWLCSTFLIRPLKRATILLVCGDLGGVNRCSMPGSVQSLSNSCSPVAACLRRPNRRSVNSLPLSVRMVRIRIGQARSGSHEASAARWLRSWP